MPVQIFQQIGELGNLYGIPCTNISDIPDLGFIFKETEYQLSSSNWVAFQMVNQTQYCFFKVRGQLHPNNIPPLVLGEPFMQSFYVQFDLDNSNVGIYAGSSATDGSIIAHS